MTSAYVPLGGVALRESLAAHFDDRALPSGHTFSGHPLAMAAGVATLRAYADEALFDRANEIERVAAQARFEVACDAGIASSAKRAASEHSSVSNSSPTGRAARRSCRGRDRQRSRISSTSWSSADSTFWDDTTSRSSRRR